MRGRALLRGTLWYLGRVGLVSVLFLLLAFSPCAAGVAFSPGPWQSRFPVPRGPWPGPGSAGKRREAPGSAAPRGWPRSRPCAGRRWRPQLGACACPVFKLSHGVTPGKVVKKPLARGFLSGGSLRVFELLGFHVVVGV